MDSIDVCIVDRQFPDKAIDLIDEACSTAKVHFDKQKVENNIISSIFAPKELTVGPDHVAQVNHNHMCE